MWDLVRVKDHGFRQLGAMSVASAEENPFKKQLELSPFDRLLAAESALHQLKEHTRMVFGLMDISNECFYGGVRRT